MIQIIFILTCFKFTYKFFELSKNRPAKSENANYNNKKDGNKTTTRFIDPIKLSFTSFQINVIFLLRFGHIYSQMKKIQ